MKNFLIFAGSFLLVVLVILWIGAAFWAIVRMIEDIWDYLADRDYQRRHKKNWNGRNF